MSERDFLNDICGAEKTKVCVGIDPYSLPDLMKPEEEEEPNSGGISNDEGPTDGTPTSTSEDGEEAGLKVDYDIA